MQYNEFSISLFVPKQAQKCMKSISPLPNPTEIGSPFTRRNFTFVALFLFHFLFLELAVSSLSAVAHACWAAYQVNGAAPPPREELGAFTLFLTQHALTSQSVNAMLWKDRSC